MKILHLIPSLGIGGTEKIVTEICRQLTNTQRFQCVVAALKNGGRAAELLQKMQLPVHFLESRDGIVPGILDTPRVYCALQRLIAREKPDILHTWLVRANVIGRLAARSRQMKVISSLRVVEKEKKFHLWAEALTEPYCDLLTVNSRAMQRFASDEIGFDAQKVIYIPNGIALPPSEPTPILQKPAITVATLSRLHYQKGIDLFLQAAAIVLKQMPQVVFKIGGDGPERKNLEALQTQLKINVQFSSWVDNPQEWMRATDIFVLPSRWEGMPNVVLEAMAESRAIVATKVSGVEDILTDSVDGFCVEPEDPQALAEKILHLIQHPNQAQQMASAARQTVEKNFTLEKMIQAHTQLYEKITRTH